MVGDSEFREAQSLTFLGGPWIFRVGEFVGGGLRQLGHFAEAYPVLASGIALLFFLFYWVKLRDLPH